MTETKSPAPGAEATRGRLYILTAALLWSTSGVFTKALTRDTALGLNDPPLLPLQIACYRVLIAGLVLATTLRRGDLSLRPLVAVMAGCFALMNVTFITAMAWGSAANAIWLQYTAPMWMYLASVWWLGEPADRRNLVSLVVGLAGIGVILYGGWGQGELSTVGVALLSGLALAGVFTCLRVLRQSSANWLTAVNFLTAGLVLLPVLLAEPGAAPSPAQWLTLVLFGGVQMGVPYWLMARGLRVVNPQEAGTLSLLEPLLNPVWVYLIADERPADATLLGGVFILGALVWRYGPWQKQSTRPAEAYRVPGPASTRVE